MTPLRPLVIGVGNRARADDAAGLIVAERLSDEAPVLLSGGDPADLIAAWAGMDWVILVDAVTTGAPAGTVMVRELLESTLPTGTVHSSHGLGPMEGLEIGRALEMLPGRLTLVGIEGATFDLGEGISAAVSRAAEVAATTIRTLLESQGHLDAARPG